jgi:hypothetical protein
MSFPTRAVALAASLLLFVAPATVSASDWAWSVTPYVWGLELGTDAEINDNEIIDQEVELPGIIDDLDFALMLHAEGQRGKHGVLFDIVTADFGDEDKVFSLGGPGQVVAKGDLEATIIEGAGIYNPRGDGTGFALIYGVRMFDIDDEIDARYELGSASTVGRRYEASETFYDALVGARWIVPMGDRWVFDGRVDASAGSTELAWSALGGAGWKWGARRQNALFLGYRFMEIELEREDRRGADITTELSLSGAVFGAKFGFGGG